MTSLVISRFSAPTHNHLESPRNKALVADYISKDVLREVFAILDSSSIIPFPGVRKVVWRIINVDFRHSKIEAFETLTVEKFYWDIFKQRRVSTCLYAHEKEGINPNKCTALPGNLACGHPGLWILPVVATASAIIIGGHRKSGRGTYEIEGLLRNIKVAMRNNSDADQDYAPGGHKVTEIKRQKELGDRLEGYFQILEELLKRSIGLESKK